MIVITVIMYSTLRRFYSYKYKNNTTYTFGEMMKTHSLTPSHLMSAMLSRVQ